MSVQKQVEQQEGERRQQQVAFVQNGYSVLAQLGVVDARDKITCGDLVRRILQDVSTESCSSLGFGQSRSNSSRRLDCSHTRVRSTAPGCRDSMHSVAARLKVRIPQGKQGQVGKAIKKLYAARYDDDASSRIPKRNVPFHGKIFAENTYWQRHVDLLEQAVEVKAPIPGQTRFRDTRL